MGKYERVASKQKVVDGRNFVKHPVITWVGKSTWPVPRKADGVKFPDYRYEMDTKKSYVYDPETDDWEGL